MTFVNSKAAKAAEAAKAAKAERATKAGAGKKCSNKTEAFLQKKELRQNCVFSGAGKGSGLSSKARTRIIFLIVRQFVTFS